VNNVTGRPAIPSKQEKKGITESAGVPEDGSSAASEGGEHQHDFTPRGVRSRCAGQKDEGQELEPLNQGERKKKSRSSQEKMQLAE